MTAMRAARLDDVIPSAAGRLPERYTLTFPDGLIGCPDWLAFTAHEDAPNDLLLLDSLDDDDVRFVLLDARRAEPAFFARVGADDLARMQTLGVGSDPAVGVFVTVAEQPDGVVTANLLGPLVIDRRRRVGMQLVLAGLPWSTRHVIEPR